jgi:hypothetical protein
MRLRARRRNLVIWSHSADPADWYRSPRRARVARTARVRRGIRLGALLTVMGMVRLARTVRPRWRPLLAGAVLTAAGVMLRSSAWSVLFLAGVWAFVYSVLIPESPDADRSRPLELKRELAGYSTPGQLRDLGATLDRYPDEVTGELRDILASRALTG